MIASVNGYAAAKTQYLSSPKTTKTTTTTTIQVLRSKDEALRCAEREIRAKDLELGALKGDLAGEKRLKAAVEAKLEEASLDRDEVQKSKEQREMISCFCVLCCGRKGEIDYARCRLVVGTPGSEQLPVPVPVPVPVP